MHPKIATKPAFTVVGLRIRAKAKSPEIAQLWDQFVPRMGGLPQSPEPYVSYGLMDNFDAGGLDYMAGNPTSEIAELPSGMAHWNVPANTYAVFDTTLATLGQTFDDIFGTWLPASGYQQAAGPYFERYGETFSPANPALEIYIPVKKKA